MNASDYIFKDDSGYVAADDTMFTDYYDAYDYNVHVLGMQSTDQNDWLLYPAGEIPQSSGQDVGNGITGPINTFNLPDTAPGSTPDGWGFLKNLASTTMQTIGGAINNRLDRELQEEMTKWNDDGTRKPTNTAAQTKSGVGTALLVAGAIAAGLAVMSK